MPSAIAGKCPKNIRQVSRKHTMKAAPAVVNHPPMTDNTPVMRNTALWRLQARSAKLVPIATMKVTYVVDKGRRRLVPMATRSPAKTRLTAARTWSNAAPAGSTTSSAEKRESIHLLTGAGTRFPKTLEQWMVVRTSVLATADEPNISSPSSWRLRSTLVFTTFFALGENTNARTMMIPANTRYRTGVWALFIRLVIRNDVGSDSPCAI